MRTSLNGERMPFCFATLVQLTCKSEKTETLMSNFIQIDRSVSELLRSCSGGCKGKWWIGSSLWKLAGEDFFKILSSLMLFDRLCFWLGTISCASRCASMAPISNSWGISHLVKLWSWTCGRVLTDIMPLLDLVY